MRHRPRPRPGHSLVELVTVLVLLGVGASLIAPGARRLGDRAAVTTAREEVVRAVARGRAEAVARGGASVVLVARPPTLRVQSRDTVLRRTPLLRGDSSVAVLLTGGRDSLLFRFDRLGIGRFANGSVTLRRGDAAAGVVVSSYGRVRRW